MYSRNRDSDFNRRHASKGGDHKGRNTGASKPNKNIKASPKTSGKVDEGKSASKEEKSQLSETSADKDKSENEER